MFMLMLDLISLVFFLGIATVAWLTLSEWRENRRCTREAAEAAAYRVKLAKRLGYER